MEGTIVHSHAGACFRLNFMDHFIRQRMPFEQVGHHMESRTDILLAGRIGAFAIGRVSIDIGFVDRHPHGDIFLQSFHRPTDEDRKLLRSIIVLPAALFSQPKRIGEMMQCDHRRQAALTQAAQHEAIFLERLFIPFVGRGLDAAPFDREAMRVLVCFDSAVKVFAPAPAPPIAGQTRFAVGMSILFPLPPVVIGIVALDLMRGSGRAPQKSTWKMKYSFRHMTSKIM